MVRKYYVTDFYNDILREIGEGKYWFAVEERVRKDYPHPDRILEFLTAEHIPLGFDAANQTLFPRTAMCDFAPLFPLFPDKDEAREMVGELVYFYAHLHWREFLSELKKRGKRAVFKEFCLHALELAKIQGWEKAEIQFVVEENHLERTENQFEGTLEEIEDYLLNGTVFTYLINTYLAPAQRVATEDQDTITFQPFLRTIPDISGTGILRRKS